MTPDERRRCERLAQAHRSVAGNPLFVPPTMAKHMRAAGMDMTNVRETQPMPHYGR